MEPLPKIPADGLFLRKGDRLWGPISLPDVEKLFNAGKVDRRTYLWFEGLSGWITVGDIPSFDRRRYVAPKKPKNPGTAELWVYDTRLETLVPTETGETLTRFRRGDLVYADNTGEWYRLDQDSRTRSHFSPSPLPIELEDTGTENNFRLLKNRSDEEAPAEGMSLFYIVFVVLVVLGVVAYLILQS